LLFFAAERHKCFAFGASLSPTLALIRSFYEIPTNVRSRCYNKLCIMARVQQLFQKDK